MMAVGVVPLKDHGQGVMDLIASDAVLDEAYAWLCDRRKDYSPHDDVWTLRERWADVKPRLQRSLLRSEYRCDVTRRVHTAAGVIEIGSAADALVLKATALVLQKEFAPVLSPRCFHLAGHGGLKGAVRAVMPRGGIRCSSFAPTSTVTMPVWTMASCIASARARDRPAGVETGLELPAAHGVRWRRVRGGHPRYQSRLSLSPLMGALYLKPLDDLMNDLICPTSATWTTG